MRCSREEKEAMAFSWGGLFTVTGLCAILFSIFFRLMDGAFSPLLIKIGTTCISMAAGRALYRDTIRKQYKTVRLLPENKR